MELQVTDAVAVALVIGLIEIVKRVLPDLDKRWIPVFALCFGVGWAIGTRYGGEPFAVAASGIALALAAVGLFSSSKAISGR